MGERLRPGTATGVEMAKKLVPVSMGSQRFTTVELDGFWLTDAWFPPGAALPMHVHERSTFAVMLEGSFDLDFPGKPAMPCPPGTVFTEPAVERHSNRIGDAGAHVLVLQPDPLRAELFRPCVALLDRANHFADARVGAIAVELLREMRRGDEVAPLAMEALGLEILATAARLQRPGGRGRRAPHPPAWLERARELVHARFRERLRASEVADEVSVHPVHLSRNFREHYGVPLSSYIRRLKLEWVAEQLVSSDEPISNLALRAGFSDQSHLTRRFKRRFGVTPARYRRETG